MAYKLMHLFGLLGTLKDRKLTLLQEQGLVPEAVGVCCSGWKPEYATALYYSWYEISSWIEKMWDAWSLIDEGKIQNMKKTVLEYICEVGRTLGEDFWWERLRRWIPFMGALKTRYNKCISVESVRNLPWTRFDHNALNSDGWHLISYSLMYARTSSPEFFSTSYIGEKSVIG